MKLKWITLLCFWICSLNADPLLIGYYTNWAQYRPEPGDFHPKNLKPILPRLTDIHYAYYFFNYDTQTQFPTNDFKVKPTQSNDAKMLTQVVELANYKPVYVSIGGWDFNDPTHPYGVTTYPFFSEMVANATHTSAFIQSCIALCRKFHLAGICIEWLFPGVPNRGGTTNDYQNLSNFLKTFQTQMHAAGFKVRMAVPGSAPANFVGGNAVITDPTTRVYTIDPTNAQTYIDWLSGISQYADLYFVMCYDYFGPDFQPNNSKHAFPLTGENAPLNPNPTIPQVDNNPTCVTQTVHAYTNNSQFSDQPTPLNKIVIGVPAYGRTFRELTFPGNLPNQPFGPGAQFKQPDTDAHFTQKVGFQSFYEVKYNLLNNYYTHMHTNPVTSTAYAWTAKNHRWVSLDNKKTATLKGQFIIKSKLAGGGVWTLPDDNFFDHSSFDITKGLANGLELLR